MRQNVYFSTTQSTSQSTNSQMIWICKLLATVTMLTLLLNPTTIYAQCSTERTVAIEALANADRATAALKSTELQREQCREQRDKYRAQRDETVRQRTEAVIRLQMSQTQNNRLTAQNSELTARNTLQQQRIEELSTQRWVMLGAGIVTGGAVILAAFIFASP